MKRSASMTNRSVSTSWVAVGTARPCRDARALASGNCGAHIRHRGGELAGLDVVDHRLVAALSGSKERGRPSKPCLPVDPAPDRLGRPHDQIQLALLVVLTDAVALLGGGEAALRRDAELIDVGVSRRLVELAL